jgi:dUTP pyrophosphatase
MPISIKLDDPKSMPFRAHPTDAGADLVATETVVVYPTQHYLFDTGVAIKIPPGYVGLVYNRSSQGKVRVQIANGTGVIDSDYRGNIKVLLINNGHEPYEVNKFSTRIAQLVIVPILIPRFDVFNPDIIGLWDDTARSTNGFGSTGT